MSATQLPGSSGATLIGNGKSYAFGQGTRTTEEWGGERNALETKFNQLIGNPRLASLEYNNRSGRATLIASYGLGSSVTPVGDTSNSVEELYAVAMTIGLALHPFFDDLSNSDRAEATKLASEKNVSVPPSAWSAKKKFLFQSIMEGEDMAYVPSFVLRKQYATTKDSRVKSLFTDVNTVVAAPKLSAHMTQVLNTLPTGEWLKMPATSSYIGRGWWQIGEEYQWATRWSIIYGGTDTRGVAGLA
jgi:hypothetical protein